MEGARYLEDGKLTIFRRNGTYYARHRATSSGEIYLAVTEDLKRADRCRAWPQVAVPNRTES